MHHELKQEAIRLRKEEELSYDAIRRKLNVAKSTLHEWLKHFPLSPERFAELKRLAWSKSEAKIEQFRMTMREKKMQKAQEVYERYCNRLRSLSEDAFFVAGLMFYSAEGGKTSESRISVANTDSRLIKFFIQWLGRFLNIPKDSLRAELHLYETMDIEKEYRFWKQELGFSDAQFYKTQIRSLRKSSFSYQESFRHGTCSLSFGSVQKKTEIMMAIKALLDLHIQNDDLGA